MPGEKLSLYVHVPFCIKKCNYCDFLSFPVGGGKPAVMERYVRALIKEIEALRDGRINLNTESEADIAIRLKRAEAEMATADKYDYIVVNDVVAKAADAICHIVEKEI